MNKISFIIVNYNLSDEIEECLISINQFITSVWYEIIIVDNNSEPSEVIKLDGLLGKFKNIYIIKNKDNLGFGKACNIGATKANSEMLVFLNPDTKIKNDFFSEILKDFKENKIGIAGVRQTSRKNVFDYSAGFYPGIIFEFINIIFLGRYVEAFLIAQKNKKNKFNKYSIDWVMGSFIMISKSKFWELNGFNDLFFMFFEEMDLCKRMKQKGYKIIYYPEYSIYHSQSKSTKKNYYFFTYHFYLSKIKYLRSHNNNIKQLIFDLLLFFQIFAQVIFWSILLPLKKEKSKGKIKAFIKIIQEVYI